MSEKWETVMGKKSTSKPKIGNGHAKPPSSPIITTAAQRPPGAGLPQKTKRKKHIGPKEYKIAPLPSMEDDEEEPAPRIQDQQAKQPKKPSANSNQKGPTKSKEMKVKDLEGALRNVPPGQLTKFYRELTVAGSSSYNPTATPANSDIYLSWIKYSADALNTKLLQFNLPPPDPSNWPNNLHYPTVPPAILDEIHLIITDTAKTRPDIDVIGLAFSTILSMIPTFIQRGDSGWGFLIFLREICRLDPDLPLRKAKTVMDLMESYGNRKEIGICILWTVAQAALDSESVLKITSTYFLPYYNFKNYKTFVLSVLSALSESPIMDGDNVIEPEEFDEFFEQSFDPKKRKDFEKFYPKVRDLTLRNLRSGRGPAIFSLFMSRLSDKNFMPLSPYGQEVFEILNGCLIHDPTVIGKWKDELPKYSRESYLLLQFLSRNPEKVNYAKKLESVLITSDEFAQACVKSPEMLRMAKKLQTGVRRVEEAKKKRFSWKFGCFFIALVIGVLLWLDVTENGKGLFAKSETGKFLERYGLLDEANFVIEKTVQVSKTSFALGTKVFRDVSESLRPLLQAVEKQVQAYIPQLKDAFQFLMGAVISAWEFLYKFFSENIFVGPLSPESLRKYAKDTLTIIWTNIYNLTTHFYNLIEKYLSDYLK